jgi:hypothetical protein
MDSSADVFRGWLGCRAAATGISWTAPTVGIVVGCRKSGYYTIPGTALPGGTVVGWFQSCCYADRIDSSDRWYHCWSG